MYIVFDTAGLAMAGGKGGWVLSLLALLERDYELDRVLRKVSSYAYMLYRRYRSFEYIRKGVHFKKLGRHDKIRFMHKFLLLFPIDTLKRYIFFALIAPTDDITNRDLGKRIVQYIMRNLGGYNDVKIYAVFELRNKENRKIFNVVKEIFSGAFNQLNINYSIKEADADFFHILSIADFMAHAYINRQRYLINMMRFPYERLLIEKFAYLIIERLKVHLGKRFILVE